MSPRDQTARVLFPNLLKGIIFIQQQKSSSMRKKTKNLFVTKRYYIWFTNNAFSVSWILRNPETIETFFVNEEESLHFQMVLSFMPHLRALYFASRRHFSELLMPNTIYQRSAIYEVSGSNLSLLRLSSSYNFYLWRKREESKKYLVHVNSVGWIFLIDS